MTERSRVVHKLLDTLELPKGTLAQLDWVTGSMRVNKSSTEWKRSYENPASDPELWITLLHEIHHFIQIGLCSYLYKFALLLRAVITPIVDKHYNDLSELPSSLDGSPESQKFVRDNVWDLTWRSQGGLSVVDIVESLTYYIQENSRKSFTGEAYREHLARASVPAVYKRGFLRFLDLTGDLADRSKLFPVVSHLSLCSHDPRKCFEILSEAVGRGEITYEVSMPQMIAFCRAADRNFGGFAWEWRRGLPAHLPAQHPVFDRVDTRLSRDELLTAKYLLFPHEFPFGQFLRDAFSGGLILNPEPDQEVANFREWPIDTAYWGKLTPREKRKKGFRLLYLAAASRKYVGAIGRPPKGVIKIS